MPEEEVWQDVYLTGDRDAPAYWFWLDLRNIPHDSTLLVHDQAIRALVEHGHDDRGQVRPLLRNALQAIAHITELRLAEPFGWAPATQYMVQAVINPKEPDEVTEGDRARFETLAIKHSECGDAGAAVVWAAAMDGVRRGPRTEPPPPTTGGA